MIVYLKRLIRNYFGFSGNQINGFMILIPLMAIIIFSVPVFRYWNYQSEPDFSADVAFLDSLVFAHQVSLETPVLRTESVEVRYTNFDPNETGKQEFLRLGFPDHIADRILHYRDAGGSFRVRSDLKKIYGLSGTLYKKVEPYIQLPDDIQRPDSPFKETVKKKYTKKVIPPFDLNTADTMQLKQIYGIGSVLSARIIKYRTQLGGFIHEHQLREVYRLDSTTLSQLMEHSFIEENFKPAGININFASEAELASHPYISYPAAKAIVAYRFQHGRYNDLDELSNIVVLTEMEREKIKPYLTIELAD